MGRSFAERIRCPARRGFASRGGATEGPSLSYGVAGPGPVTCATHPAHPATMGPIAPHAGRARRRRGMRRQRRTRAALLRRSSPERRQARRAQGGLRDHGRIERAFGKRRPSVVARLLRRREATTRASLSLWRPRPSSGILAALTHSGSTSGSLQSSCRDFGVRPVLRVAHLPRAGRSFPRDRRAKGPPGDREADPMPRV